MMIGFPSNESLGYCQYRPLLLTGLWMVSTRWEAVRYTHFIETLGDEIWTHGVAEIRF
jgi:hypothetical protein